MSKWGDSTKQSTLLVKRRIFCSAFTLNIQRLDKVHLESLYENISHSYSNTITFGEYLKIDAIVKITALLYLIRQKRKGHEKIEINIGKISKAVNEMIPRPYLMKKEENEWVERIEGILNYNVKWQELDLNELYREFLYIFTSSPLFAASYFFYKKKDNIADRSLPIEGVICVNVFGLFFFNQQHRDKPSYYLYFEDLSYVIGNDQTFKICYIDKKFGTEIQATLETPRARELAEDIISYSSIRNLEKNYVSCFSFLMFHFLIFSFSQNFS